MDSALPMLLFLGFVVGSMTLMLVFGYQTHEEEMRRAQTKARPARSRVEGAAVLVCADVTPCPLPTRSAGENSTVERLEAHLRRERAAAEEFVAEPTLERLFRSTSESVEARIRALEERLQDERVAVASFATNPSVRGLFRAVRSREETGGRADAAPVVSYRAVRSGRVA